MNRVIINREALGHNLAVIDSWMRARGARWSVVTKSLCGFDDAVAALYDMGVRSIADSRLANLEGATRVAPEAERWFLRLPDLSTADEVVRLSQISLNSESSVIRALSEAAVEQQRLHRVVIMVELGDLREGILPGTLTGFFQKVFNLPGIEVVGIGAQLGCLSGAVPTVDQFTNLLLYRELVELKFQHKLPIVSAGSSVALGMLLSGEIPRRINHFRVGEALFLGTDLLQGGTLPGLRDDVVRLEAEIAEITKKGLVPAVELGATTPFANGDLSETEEAPAPGERGFRAVVTVGQLDTDVTGLTPIAADQQIAGASSDMLVLNLGDSPAGLEVGDSVAFRVSYSAFVRLMGSAYVQRLVESVPAGGGGEMPRRPEGVVAEPLFGVSAS